jgi:hypothetical protein
LEADNNIQALLLSQRDILIIHYLTRQFLLIQLLKRNETVLLFPGGAKEALHGKGEEYKLFWCALTIAFLYLPTE